jgi:hypothetical protein
MKSAGPLVLIAAAAALVWAPTLFIAAPGDSFSYDLNWAGQFGALLRAGDPYPRWLPASFGALGSPTFYFYPPASFWTAALIGAASGGALTAAMQVKLATLALFVGSGWAMWAWLRAQTTPLRAVIGALAFLVAPYHVDDHYLRGAFAELAAFVAIPVLALGLDQTSRGVRAGPLALAGGWAGLIFAHLPIAMLTGALLVPALGAYSLWRAQRRRAFALAGALALGVGTAIAAIYLVPALQLQPFISADYWWSAKFQAADRLLTNPAAWSLPLEPFFGAIAFAEAIVGAWMGWLAWRGRDARLGFWAAMTVLVFAATTGLLPGFWWLPLMAKAQFPWRAMTIGDFAFVTLIALAPRGAAPIAPVVFVALALGNAAALGRDLAAGPAAARTLAGYGAASFPTDADAPEYLPRGMLRMTADGPAPATPLATLQAAPPAVAAGVVRAGPDSSLEIVPQPGAREVVLRRFYFPAWRIRCDGHPLAAAPFGPGRLVSFAPPAGARRCVAGIGATAAERYGAAIAGVGVAIFALYAAWLIAPRRRRDLPPLDRGRPAPI